MAATWLSHMGVQTRIVDKRGAKIVNGHADGLHIRTLEIFDSFGLANKIMDRSAKFVENCAWVCCSNQLLADHPVLTSPRHPTNAGSFIVSIRCLHSHQKCRGKSQRLVRSSPHPAGMVQRSYPSSGSDSRHKHCIKATLKRSLSTISKRARSYKWSEESSQRPWRSTKATSVMQTRIP